MAIDPATGQSIVTPAFDQNLAAFLNPQQFGALQAQQGQLTLNGELGQAMLRSGYIPNSGFAGALAQGAQALIGMKMLNDSRQQMASLYQQQLQMMADAKKAQHEQMLADKKAEADIEANKLIGIHKGEGDYDLSVLPQKNKAEAEKAGMVAQAQLPSELTKIKLQGQNSANSAYIGATAGLQQKIAQAKAMGATDDQIKAMVVGSDAFMMGGPVGQAASSGLTGEDFLKSLPKAQSDTVKALADGRMQFPGGAAMRSPYWQNMLQAVSAYDPQFDAVNYNARAATRKDFTSGKDAGNINALNTVMGHLGELSDQAQKLDNFGGPLTLLNAPKNALKNAFGSPDVKNFEINRQAAVDELERAYRGAGGSESELKQWKEQLSTAGSPAQLQGAIGKISDLLGSKVNALQSQYAAGMGKAQDQPNFITPHAQEALQKVAARAGGDQAPATPTQTAINPKTGQRIGLVNGQWVPLQ